MSTIVDGQAGITFPDSSNQQTVGYTGGGIYFTASNNISYSISSDARLKTNVTVGQAGMAGANSSTAAFLGFNAEL